MTRYYFRLECLRMLRDPRYLALAVITPIGFYLLFATLLGGKPAGPGELPGTVEIMVAMGAYGAIWGALSATARASRTSAVAAGSNSFARCH